MPLDRDDRRFLVAVCAIDVGTFAACYLLLGVDAMPLIEGLTTAFFTVAGVNLCLSALNLLQAAIHIGAR